MIAACLTAQAVGYASDDQDESCPKVSFGAFSESLN
jgi:hypothetical protein